MPEPRYSAAWLASLTPSEQEAALSRLTPTQIEFLKHDWHFWRREKQTPPPGDWTYWLIKAGRGYGKTRVGAEWVRECVRDFPLVNLAGATADDARDIMIEGESGILAVCPKDERPIYRKSDRQLHWPNGARSLIFTADEPERFRGKQHMKFWADELASWRYPEAWIQMKLGLRLGARPQAVVTTTPRPTPLIKELLADPACVVTEGSTYENRPNLSPTFFATVIKQYEGTRLGRQELLAHVLDDNPNALFKRDWIERDRVVSHPDLTRVVVAIDPAATNEEGSAETGIVVAGSAGDDFYVLADRSLHASPEGWARAAIVAYHLHSCDRAVGEANNGGDMIEALLRNVDPNVSYEKVTATRGKMIRAEPISALYEQGRVHHVGTFPALEDQMAEWEPGMDSPDRMDALVWALTELSTGGVRWLPSTAVGEAREAWS
jgi:phage terminase large subunit-like protein